MALIGLVWKVLFFVGLKRKFCFFFFFSWIVVRIVLIFLRLLGIYLGFCSTFLVECKVGLWVLFGSFDHVLCCNSSSRKLSTFVSSLSVVLQLFGACIPSYLHSFVHSHTDTQRHEHTRKIYIYLLRLLSIASVMLFFSFPSLFWVRYSVSMLYFYLNKAGLAMAVIICYFVFILHNQLLNQYFFFFFGIGCPNLTNCACMKQRAYVPIDCIKMLLSNWIWWGSGAWLL